MITKKPFEVTCRDAFDGVESLDDHSVDCVITSPPYFQQRRYTKKHRIEVGTEPTVEEYVRTVTQLFDIVHRKLRDTGTVFLNMGDKYIVGRLSGAPWRTVIRMVDTGRWVLKNDVIWHRNRIAPHSAKNRFTPCHEHVFFLAKDAKGYTFNWQDVQEEAKWKHDRRANKGRHVYRESRGDKAHTAAVSIKDKRLRRDVWTIETAQTNGKHSATYPAELSDILVQVGSNPGDTVLDPFVGTGTTGVSALTFGRKFIGFDINKSFVKMANDRLKEQLQ